MTPERKLTRLERKALLQREVSQLKGRQQQFVKVGERIRFIGTSKSRGSEWPEGAWLEKGVEGVVAEFHPRSPTVRVGGEYFEAIPAWATVQWDNGGKTAIDPETERVRWKRVKEK